MKNDLFLLDEAKIRVRKILKIYGPEGIVSIDRVSRLIAEKYTFEQFKESLEMEGLCINQLPPYGPQGLIGGVNLSRINLNIYE